MPIFSDWNVQCQFSQIEMPIFFKVLTQTVDPPFKSGCALGQALMHERMHWRDISQTKNVAKSHNVAKCSKEPDTATYQRPIEPDRNIAMKQIANIDIISQKAVHCNQDKLLLI